MDIRKFGIMIAVAIVSVTFIYAVATAIAPEEQWTECGDYPKYYAERVVNAPNCTAVPIDRVAEQACIDQGFNYQPTYDEYGCTTGYTCSTCQKENMDRMEERSATVFYTMVVLGIIAIIIGFLLPLGTVNEWVGLGFIIGGVISMFWGTVQYWNDFSRFMRPLVIGAELAILLFIIYRRMNSESKPKKKR